MITDAQYQEWLERSGKSRCALFELTFLGTGAGSPVAGEEFHAYVSNYAYITAGGDSPAHQTFDDCVLEVPSFTRRMSEQLSGRSTQAFGDLIIANNNGEREDWVRMNWDGRRVRMWIGHPSWAFDDFRLVLDGVVSDVFDAGANKIGFKIADKAALLDRPVMTTLLGGTGPQAGDVMPLALGSQLVNITPKLIDPITHKYRFTQSGGGEVPFTDNNSYAENPLLVREDGDNLFGADVLESSSAGADTLHATAHGFVAGTRIQFPYDGGVTSPPAPVANTILGSPPVNYWVSTDGLATDDFKLAPTLADALAGTNTINITGAQTGTPDIYHQGWTSHGDGTFTLAGNPAGLITCDVAGLTSPGSPAALPLTAGAIVEQVLTSSLTNTPLTVADLDLANIAAFEALATASLAIYVTEQKTFTQLLDEILTSVGGWWGFSREGKLQLGRLDLPAPGSPPGEVYSFIRDDVALRSMKMARRILPAAEIKRTGIANWTPQSVVAASVAEFDRVRYATRDVIFTGQAAVTTWDTDPTNHINATRAEPRLSYIAAGYGVTGLQVEVDRLAEMYQYPTAVFTFQTHQAVFLLLLGSLIYVEHPRYTGYGVVVGTVERIKGRCEVSFFCQLVDEYPTGDLE